MSDHTANIILPTEPAPEVSINKTLSLNTFIQQFGEGLLQAVSQQNPPIYDEGAMNVARMEIMAQLKRKPFAAQQRVVQAITRLLIDEQQKAAIINGEMGCGKTMLGIATAAVMHQEGFKRTLILSPPHLVYKWRREILDTVENAKVWILNGPDTLMKLLRLRDMVNNKETSSNEPEFFIMGRVRLRMGFQWQPAVFARKKHERVYTNAQDTSSPSYIETQQYVACTQCGEFVKDSENHYIRVEVFPIDKRYNCKSCKTPLWSLVRTKQLANRQALIKQSLCQLPTIGEKRAEKLLNLFGEEFLISMLTDNIYQFINLMDDNGQLVFSDRQAQRLERAFAKMEFGFGQGGYQPSEFIKRYLPKHFFSLLIADEAHEFKNYSSAQGQAMGVIASQVEKILLLTGTLMGGYAEDLFHLLWRCMPHQMLKDGYRYRRGSLNSAVVHFMDQHGIVKTVRRSTKDVDNHKTARGKKESVQVMRAPGFGPKGISRYILPYTAFIKLNDIDANVLPTYQEHFFNIPMEITQHEHYKKLEHRLREELRKALWRGDHSVLGTIMNCLLAWPDCCFKPEVVTHPHKRKEVWAFMPSLFTDEPSPKEQEMIDLCRQAKQRGQRTLVYTIYTGTRDTTVRLKHWLEREGFKAAVLRSSVETDKREDWIADQVDKGIDVLICHPELVKTGLDLLDFPNIIFMQSGYNVYTLMQASRRSWRIGQRVPVNVYFLGYQDSMQIACLSLMAKKIAVSQSTAGTMPETGLDILNQDGESVEVALAKQLVG